MHDKERKRGLFGLMFAMALVLLATALLLPVLAPSRDGRATDLFAAGILLGAVGFVAMLGYRSRVSSFHETVDVEAQPGEGQASPERHLPPAGSEKHPSPPSHSPEP